MNSPKHIIKAGVAVILSYGLSVAAYAQIGVGWKAYFPSYTTQIEGCGFNNNFYFSIICPATHAQDPNFQRAERRYADVTSGQSQFQGTVVVNTLGGDKICLKQTFQDPAGPFNMIAVEKPGDIYEVEGGQHLAKYTIGTSVRINTITNISAKTVAVYINGALVELKTSAKTPLYDKFGTYRTVSGYGPIQTHWSNIAFWKK